MSQISILRILPLLILATPVAVLAKNSIVPMTLGQRYTGSLTPSPENPNGEVCYGLSVEPDTRITLDIKTSGVGIVKFAVYDKTKGLRFFHNDVNTKRQDDTNAATDSRFSFPAVSDVSQLCLTTSNTDRGQQYNFTAIGKRIRKSKSKIVLRPVDTHTLTAPPPVLTAQPKSLTAQSPKKIDAPPPPPPNAPAKAKPPTAPVEIPPAPVGEPYCYVGTWQIGDLNAYWLPSVQTFTQAKITDPQMMGYAKVTLEKDGYATFEAFDLEQRYTLRAKETGARIDRLGLGVSGRATARFQPNKDGTLSFNSQNYNRLTTKLNLSTSLKFTADRSFEIFGDRNVPQTKSAYTCLDRDTMMLRVNLPMGQKSIPITLKRIN